MRLCDGFAGHGNHVTVVYPYTYMRGNISSQDIPSAYGLRNTVHRRLLLTPLLEKSPKLWRFIVLLIGFSFSAFRIAVEGIFLRRKTLILSRDAKALIPAIIFRKLLALFFNAKVIYIASEVKDRPIFKWVVKNSDGVIAGVTSTREAIQRLVPIEDKRFTLSLAPVPAPIVNCSKSEARKEIGYNSSSPLIVYTGKLGMDVNELKYIFTAASMLPKYNFLFTGGRPSAVESVKKYCFANGIDNVQFTGFFKDSTYVRYYQLAADVLVSYYTAKDHLVDFNYPQKVNEYMTTGNVVVTPDFLATRDVVNEKNVIFVKPDCPEDLARGIKMAIENREQSEQLARQALMDMRDLTFEKRTLDFLVFAEQL
ncbi:MAG: hypothetical protein RIQ47_1962 [Bacteroidota bacterium]|jgi:glycosyltransferase involved in cell wall biosynthesis